MARSFANAGDRIQVASNAAYDLTAGSVSLRHVTSQAAAEIMLHERNNPSGAITGINLHLRADNSFPQLEIYGAGAFSILSIVGTASQRDGAWHQVGCEFDQANGGACRLVADGVSVATGNVTEAWTFGAFPLNWADGGDPYWAQHTGSMAEAAWWSVKLTAEEWAALGKGVSPEQIRPASLVDYWRFGGRNSPETSLKSTRSGTLTGTAYADHPRVFYARRGGLIAVPSGAAVTYDIDAAPGSYAITGTAATLVAGSALAFVAKGTTVSVASGNVTLNEPAGVAAGDLLIAAISYRDTAAFTLPANWTQIAQLSAGNTSTTASTAIASGCLASIIRGASAPSFAFTRTAGSAGHGQVVAYRGAGGAISQVDQASVTMAANGTLCTGEGTVDTDGSTDNLLVTAFCGADNCTFDAYTADAGQTTGWTEREDSGTNLGADTALGIADAIQAAAANTDNPQCTASVSSRHVILAVRFKEGAASVALDAAPGSYAITGTAAPVVSGRSLDAASGSYSLTGLAATLAVGRFIDAAPGAYSITGFAATLAADRALNAAAATYALTGIAATTAAGRVIDAAPGSYSETGEVAATIVTRAVVASPGAYSLTGAAALAVSDRFINAAASAYTLTGTAATLAFGYALDAVPGTYGITGAAATVVATRAVDAVPGAYAFTGFAAALATAGVSINASPGSFAVTGSAATLASARAINAAPASYALTGSVAQTAVGRFINAASGAYVATGFAATTTPARSVVADAGSFAFTGFAATLATTGAQVLVGAPGAFVFTGAVAGTVVDRFINAAPGSYALTGIEAGASATRTINAEAGTYAAAGDASLIADRFITADSGAYVSTGFAATIELARSISAQPGSYATTGIAAGLVYSPPLGTFVFNAEPGAFTLTGALAQFERIDAPLPGPRGSRGDVLRMSRERRPSPSPESRPRNSS